MDPIERQDAIDAICKACSMEGDYHKCNGYPETSTWCDELVALRALPSAQQEIIRCKNCKYYEIAWLKKDGTDNKRYKPSICVRGQYGITRKPDWFCANAERREDERSN